MIQAWPSAAGEGCVTEGTLAEQRSTLQPSTAADSQPTSSNCNRHATYVLKAIYRRMLKPKWPTGYSSGEVLQKEQLYALPTNYGSGQRF